MLESAQSLRVLRDTDVGHRDDVHTALLEALSVHSFSRVTRSAVSASTYKAVSRYIRRKTGASLAPKVLSQHVKTFSGPTSQGPTTESSYSFESEKPDHRNTVTSQDQLKPSFVACVYPIDEPRLPPLSMSKRRIASRIPALDCLVEIPPASDFLLANISGRTIRPHLDSPALPTFPGPPNPITPLEQIIHTPDDPPTLFPSRLRASKLKPKLSISTTVRAEPNQSHNIDANTDSGSPYIPFTPLDCVSPTFFDSPSLHLSVRLGNMKLDDTSASRTNSPPSDMNISLKSRTLKTHRPLSFLPRKLSYRSPLPTSPLASNMASNISQLAEANDLASPFFVQRTSFSASALQTVTSLPQGSPTAPPRSSGYF